MKFKIWKYCPGWLHWLAGCSVGRISENMLPWIIVSNLINELLKTLHEPWIEWYLYEIPWHVFCAQNDLLCTPYKIVVNALSLSIQCYHCADTLIGYALFKKALPLVSIARVDVQYGSSTILWEYCEYALLIF